jgi:hypothetical protein
LAEQAKADEMLRVQREAQRNANAAADSKARRIAAEE